MEWRWILISEMEFNGCGLSAGRSWHEEPCKCLTLRLLKPVQD